MKRYCNVEPILHLLSDKDLLESVNVGAVLQALQHGLYNGEVAPVVHAHWIEDCGDYKCSHCSTEFWDEIVFIVRTSEYEFPNYCPVCGAKMDEKEGNL